jgi:outer membrane lipoprotein-sorting protein
VAAQKSAKSPKTAAPAPIPAAEAVARANAWLDAARVMTADFVQIGPDGRRSEGELSLVRPGRMRFEYTEPARLEVVADGRSVAIIDRKLNTQDEYFIGQTPLKFLLSDHIDMAHDTRVLSVAQEGNTVTIEVEDRAALGGTAHLAIVFDASIFALKQWTLIDAQGFQTVVTLFNLDLRPSQTRRCSTSTKRCRPISLATADGDRRQPPSPREPVARTDGRFDLARCP